ncbi:MAG: sulfotransferase [Methylococcaceae bacterium]
MPQNALPPQIFILGSQRSGTTEMFNLLTKIIGYSGDVECHLWPSMQACWDTLDESVAGMGGRSSPAYKAFTIGKVGVENIRNEIAAALTGIYTKQFGPQWIDKTPGVKMIKAVPMLSEIFPESKFIFMKRRGIENVMSKQRRFKGQPLQVACSEWADSMRAWRHVRERVEGRYIEIDQQAMATSPHDVALQLCTFLGGDISLTQKAASFLENTRSEQTSQGSQARTLALPDTGWNDEEQALFIETCASMMVSYGYSFDSEELRDPNVPPTIPLVFIQSADFVAIFSSTKKSHFWPEGLKLICEKNSGKERVVLRDIRLCGQDTLLSSLRCHSPKQNFEVLVTLTLKYLNGHTEKNAFSLKKGDKRELSWFVGKIDEDVTITFQVEVTSPVGNGQVVFLHPRMGCKKIMVNKE